MHFLEMNYIPLLSARFDTRSDQKGWAVQYLVAELIWSILEWRTMHRHDLQQQKGACGGLVPDLSMELEGNCAPLEACSFSPFEDRYAISCGAHTLLCHFVLIQGLKGLDESWLHSHRMRGTRFVLLH
jgi:hypothetical protein